MKARLPKEYANRGPGDMNSIMRQAQKMQEEMARTQEELEQKEYSAQSGGGAVSVVMNGKKELLSLKLEPEIVDPEDIEMLEDLITAAVNEVISMVETDSSEKMNSITSGMSLPGGMF